MLAVKSDPITFASESPAQYLVDVNANDLACLGATPRWMMVTALLPEGTTEDEVETHFRELRDACVRRGISLVGGHTEITFGLRRPILVGVLLGEVDADRLLRPGGARPGDRLLLTKAIAIEGTALVARELGERLRAELDPALVARAANFLVDPGNLRRRRGNRPARRRWDHRAPRSRPKAASPRASVSSRSRPDAAPRSTATPFRCYPETAAIARALDLDPLGMLASGSLLAAAQPDAVERLVGLGLGVTPIGELTAASRFVLRGRGGRAELPAYDSDETTRVLGN